jgi:hypothetical protein
MKMKMSPSSTHVIPQIGCLISDPDNGGLDGEPNLRWLIPCSPFLWLCMQIKTPSHPTNLIPFGLIVEHRLADWMVYRCYLREERHVSF